MRGTIKSVSQANAEGVTPYALHDSHSVVACYYTHTNRVYACQVSTHKEIQTHTPTFKHTQVTTTNMLADTP